MDAKEKWNLIVDQYIKNYIQVESKIQEIWESYCSELLNFNKVLKEFDSQRSIHVGSSMRAIPDIILRKNNEDVFDIELKKYNAPFTQIMEDQLISYMDLLHISSGMIICQKIYLYSYDYLTKKSKKFEIEFKKDNPDGIKLIELLQKDNFDSERIKQYIKNKLEEKTNIQNIKNEVNDDFVKTLVYDYLNSMYFQNEVDEALKDVNFKVVKKEDIEKNNMENNKNTNTINRIKTPQPITDDEDFPNDTRFIIIKTSEKRVQVCNGSLYDATRYCWRARMEKVNDYPYVLAVIDKYVKEVYKVKYWQEAELWDTADKVDGRLQFVGDIAPDEIRNKWIGKKIPFRYRKPGMASPLVFSDINY